MNRKPRLHRLSAKDRQAAKRTVTLSAASTLSRVRAQAASTGVVAISSRTLSVPHLLRLICRAQAATLMANWTVSESRVSFDAGQ